MTTKVRFDVLSKIRCSTPGCYKFLKINIVARKSTPLVCYSCYRKKRATALRPIRTAREIRNKPHLRSLRRTHVPLKAY